MDPEIANMLRHYLQGGDMKPLAKTVRGVTDLAKYNTAAKDFTKYAIKARPYAAQVVKRKILPWFLGDLAMPDEANAGEDEMLARYYANFGMQDRPYTAQRDYYDAEPLRRVYDPMPYMR
jgi:hypothetical protein